MTKFGPFSLLAISLAAVVALSTGDADAGKIKDTFTGLLEKEQYQKTPLDQVPHTLLVKPVASGELGTKFGVRLKSKGFSLPKKHKGIDYEAPIGTAVFAAGDGVVISRRVSKSYGNFLKISHANGFATTYAHLDRFADNIEEGTEVTRGEVIAFVGNTGQSTNAHLHYELIFRGKKVDPLYAEEKEKFKFKFKFKSEPETDSDS